MDGIIANLKSICDLAEKYDALVMVDDSHAVGFMGKTGRGTHEYCNVMGRVDIITGTLGKVLGGASGGYTSATFRDRDDAAAAVAALSLLEFGRAADPGCVAESDRDLHALDRARDRLEANTKYFRREMTERKFNIVPGEHPITPIMIGDAALAGKMAERCCGTRGLCDRFLLPGRAAGQSPCPRASLGRPPPRRTWTSRSRHSPRWQMSWGCREGMYCATASGLR